MIQPLRPPSKTPFQMLLSWNLLCNQILFIRVDIRHLLIELFAFVLSSIDCEITIQASIDN